MSEPDILDVIIVGAGPCGLATAARLREPTPAALFTDEEHRRYHWIGRHGRRVALRHVKSGKHTRPQQGDASAEGSGHHHHRMLVLDADGDRWLARWRRLFCAYGIEHLRSPMLWHLDPLDRDALLGYAFAGGREGEMVEIRGCVGREQSKHARKKAAACRSGRACGAKQDARVAINIRERNDYHTPSHALFCDHCEDVISRYRLTPDLLRQESLADLDYAVVPGVSAGDEKLFTVTTGSAIRYARSVVLAVGPANKPVLPVLPSLQPLLDAGRSDLPCCHAMNIQSFPAPVLRARISSANSSSSPVRLLVVGGGLTSAQLSDLAVRSGVSHVTHLMRGPCRVKHFDVDLAWMGKYKNAEQARFWAADDDAERLRIMRDARGGGSLTPLFHKRLKRHVAAGRLRMITETELVDAEYHEPEATGGGQGGQGRERPGWWTITTSPPQPDLPAFDYIYFATGIQSDVLSLPYLQTLHRKHPIDTMGGFPCLTEDLAWSKDVPLFVVGRLAALQLGPAAPNIGGAKLGAERVAWAVDELARREGWDGDADFGQQEKEAEGKGVVGYGYGYSSGHGNMYACLCDESE